MLTRHLLLSALVLSASGAPDVENEAVPPVLESSISETNELEKSNAKWCIQLHNDILLTSDVITVQNGGRLKLQPFKLRKVSKHSCDRSTFVIESDVAYITFAQSTQNPIEFSSPVSMIELGDGTAIKFDLPAPSR